MKYYAERNNLLNNNFHIPFIRLKEYFFQIYKYFDNMNLFEVAYNGAWTINDNLERKQLHPPTMSPSPEIFFMNHLNTDRVYPIWKYYKNYSEEELFTVIEILYDHIGKYDYDKETIVKEKYKNEFSMQINNLLKRYSKGYYLNEKFGFIMKLPNDSLISLMQEKIPESMSSTEIEQLKTAFSMYYRYDSNEEQKKKAINILADILEPLREDLKNVLNREYGINKNKHDKLIFEIVNNFNIRHNDKKQFNEYNKSIWYDWMMHYYTSVIYTYYKLKTHYT